MGNIQMNPRPYKPLYNYTCWDRSRGVNEPAPPAPLERGKF